MISVLTAVVVGTLLFAVGYFWRGFTSARGNFRTAKSGVPAARKSYYSSLWLLIKWGLGAAVLVLVLASWTARDVSDASDSTPVPSPAHSPAAKR